MKNVYFIHTMSPNTSPDHSISVIIPAFNEAATVGAVVRVAKSHPRISEVLVVDDGSFDQTGREAEAAGAKVLRLWRNRGKAGAMDRGVAEASSSILYFIDADMIGLTHAMMDAMLAPVLSGSTDMFVAVVGRKRFANWLIRFLPLLGGVRVLRRAVWESVPLRYRHGFQIELAMNFFARKNGLLLVWEVIPGLKHVIKERKRGFFWGLYQRVFMIADIVGIILKLHVGERWRSF
jgi:glycosyltransferase involved in cell wall biosynthesis